MASFIKKCGYLKIKRPPTSGKVRIKAWQSKYFVLRDVPPIFEYFKDELSYSNARHIKEKNTINLENVIHIGTTDASKTQRNAFMIVVAGHGAIMLASDSEQDTKEWVEALNKVSGKTGSARGSPNIGEFIYSAQDQSPVLSRSHRSTSLLSSAEPLESPVSITENVQGFPVTTRLTPSSEKLGIRDDYTMYITDRYVAIHNIDTNTLIVQWPIVGLRGWKSEPADAAGRRGTRLLTLEAGRKSATGEGLFQFFTDFGVRIANKIRERSIVLSSIAVEKREKFKERSNSFEDITLDATNTKTKSIVKSSTDPRPVASFIIPVLDARSESDSNIFGSHQTTPSPQSLRRELNQDEPEESADNTYLDLISDTDAKTVHIVDSFHGKSLDSLSLNSDEGIIMQKTLLNTVNEINGTQNYIDDREINVYRKKKLYRRSLEDKNDAELYSDPTTIKQPIESKTKNLTQSTPPSNALCQNFLDQLSNPQSHQGNIFREKQNSSFQEKSIDNSKNENTETASVLETDKDEDSIACQKENDECSNSQSESAIKKSNVTESNDPSSEKASSDLDLSQEEEFPSMLNKPRSQSQCEKRVFPHGKEEAKDLLEKLVSNLQEPQTCTQQRIFPPLSRREDKIEKLTLTKTDAPPQSSVRHSELKKTIEKSKSHCGFDTKQQTERPPPLPTRPEMASHARTKPSASLGDISKDLPRPLDFHKDIHRQLTPWNKNTPALGAPWGPESVVHARLLHRSTSGSSLGALRETQLRGRSMRGSVDSPSPNQENERIPEEKFDSKKRRGPKASTIISRVLNTLNPADSKRRASCDIVSNGGMKDFEQAKRGRSCSVVPGGIVNEGLSPEQSLDVPSPEGSPQTLRKTLPGARRLSHDPNLDRARKLFIGSPTFESRSKEEMRQREKARERERERSELPNEPPPQLPPRKKSDPPPLPPRLRKSSSDSCCSGPSSPKGRLNTLEQTINIECDESAPPPIPPRRLDDRRESHPAPAIHFTMSSPEEKPMENVLDRPAAEETADSSISGVSRTKQPTDDIRDRTPKDSSVSCPIPQRPKTTDGEMPSRHAQRMDQEVTQISTTKEIHRRVTKKSENSFVSIEMQERTETCVIQRDHEERLVLHDIERDSFDACTSPSQGCVSPKTGHGTLSPQGSNGSTERCSPGHTPPLSLNLSSRNGGIVLGDSPTTPISV